MKISRFEEKSMRPSDKTEQFLKEKFDQLGESESDVNKREVRSARRKIKQQMHKNARNKAKRELRDVIEGSDE